MKVIKQKLIHPLHKKTTGCLCTHESYFISETPIKVDFGTSVELFFNTGEYCNTSGYNQKSLIENSYKDYNYGSFLLNNIVNKVLGTGSIPINDILLQEHANHHLIFNIISESTQEFWLDGVKHIITRTGTSNYDNYLNINYFLNYIIKLGNQKSGNNNSVLQNYNIKYYHLRFFNYLQTDQQAIELYNNGRPDLYVLPNTLKKGYDKDFRNIEWTLSKIENQSYAWYDNIEECYRLKTTGAHCGLSIKTHLFLEPYQKNFIIELETKGIGSIAVIDLGVASEMIEDPSTAIIELTPEWTKHRLVLNSKYNSRIQLLFKRMSNTSTNNVCDAYIRDIKYCDATCISEYLSENLTPNVWFDSSGMNNHLYSKGKVPIKLLYNNVYEDCIVATTAPNRIPEFKGQLWINKNVKAYRAINNKSVNDWEEITN